MVRPLGLLGLASLTRCLPAAASSAGSKASGRVVGQRTPVSLGILADDGNMTTVVPRNAALPVKRWRTITSVSTVEILAGVHPMVKVSYRLGHLDLRPSIPQGARVRLSFEVDSGGLLTVTAEDEATRQVARAFFHNYQYMHRAFARDVAADNWCALVYLQEQLSLVGAAFSDQSRSAEEVPLLLSSKPFGFANLTGGQLDSNGPGGSSANLGFAHADDNLGPRASEMAWSQAWDHARSAETRSRALVGTTIMALSFASLLIAQRSSVLAERLAPDARRANSSQLEDDIRALQAALSSQGKELEDCRQKLLTSIEDFPCVVYDETAGQETARFINVQCPGVGPDDVEIMAIFNGAVIMISRKESRLAPQLNWQRKFQFQLDEGQFEFQEEQVRLEHGILSIVFRVCSPQPRIFRFRQHSMPSSPGDCGCVDNFSLQQWMMREEDGGSQMSKGSADGWICALRSPREMRSPAEVAGSHEHRLLVALPPQPPEGFALSPLPTESSICCAASLAPSPTSSH